MRPKINLIDKRWAIKLQDRMTKVDRQLVKVEEMLAVYAKTSPVSINLKHVQAARRELAAVAAFAHFTKQIVKQADEVKG